MNKAERIGVVLLLISFLSISAVVFYWLLVFHPQQEENFRKIAKQKTQISQKEETVRAVKKYRIKGNISLPDVYLNYYNLTNKLYNELSIKELSFNSKQSTDVVTVDELARISELKSVSLMRLEKTLECQGSTKIPFAYFEEILNELPVAYDAVTYNSENNRFNLKIKLYGIAGVK